MIKVLIVDDNSFQLELIKESLSSDNRLLIYSTTDSLLAYEFAFLINPDVIILDVVMPRLDGIGLRKLLLSDEKTKNIPVIFLSGSKEDKKRGLDLGCYEYVLKPFNTEKMINLIRNCRISQIISDIRKDIANIKF